jgi:hypothetical protein
VNKNQSIAANETSGRISFEVKTGEIYLQSNESGLEKTVIFPAWD